MAVVASAAIIVSYGRRRNRYGAQSLPVVGGEALGTLVEDAQGDISVGSCLYADAARLPGGAEVGEPAEFQGKVVTMVLPPAVQGV